jgi:hypothetical protein
LQDRVPDLSLYRLVRWLLLHWLKQFSFSWDETLAAAKAIARRMENEEGVRAAVESFHRHLPIEKMQCDLIPDQPAVWTLKSGRKPVKVSKVAAEVLVSQWSKMRKELKT